MPILQPDANTYALWWMDEPAQQVVQTDSANNAAGLGVPPAGATHNPCRTKGPNGIGIGLVGNSTQDTYLVDEDPAGTHRTFFSSGDPISISFFARQDVAATGNIICYSGSGESEAANCFNVFIDNVGYMGLNFEAGSGTDTTPRQASGTGLTLGQWHHCAITITQPIPSIPITYRVEFYLDGVFQDDYTGEYAAERYTGGTASMFGLFTDFNVLLPFKGAVKDIKFRHGVSSPLYIATDAATISTTAEQVLDEDTYILFRLQDQPDAVDQKNHLHLTSQSVLGVLANRPLTADSVPTARSKVFNGGSTSVLASPFGDPVAVDLATVLRATCSIDFWLRAYPESGSGVEHGIFLLNSQVSEAQAGNFFAIALEFNSTTNGYSLRYNWETGSGTDQTYTTPNNTISYIAMHSGRGTHVGIVKEVSGSNCVFKTYIDGALFDVSGSKVNYDGTMLDPQSIFLLGVAYNTGFIGQLDEVRISTVARTADEYAAIFATGGGNIILPPPGSRYGTGGEI